MKLLIDLQKIWDTGLAMRIIHQDESLRGKGEIFRKGFTTINSTIAEPGIYQFALFIRGSLYANDESYGFCKFESEEARDKMYDFVIEAQNEINGAPKTIKDVRVGDVFMYTEFTGDKKLIMCYAKDGNSRHVLIEELEDEWCNFCLNEELFKQMIFIHNIFDEMDAQIELEEFIEE